MKFHQATRVNSDAEVCQWMKDAGLSPEMIEREVKEMSKQMLYLDETETYQVAVRKHIDNGFDMDMTHLSIKRVDKGAIHDWRIMQEIKNALVGPECEAFEMYPAESRLVDSANQYHLWCFANPTVRIPCGFFDRLVTDKPLGKSKQRPFAKAGMQG